MPIDAKWSPGQKEAFVKEWVDAGKPAFKAFAEGREFSEKSLREWATAQGAYTPVPAKGRKPKSKPKAAAPVIEPAPEAAPESAPETTPKKEEAPIVTGQQALDAIVKETSTATVPMQAPPAKEAAPPPPSSTEPKEEAPEPRRGVPPVVWYIVGGVVVLGAVVLIVRAMNAQRTAPPRVENPNRERRPYDEIRNQFGTDPGDIPVPGA